MGKIVKQRVSEVITADNIKEWKQGNIISIIAGTGAGKSYFVKNDLYSHAKRRNKKILFLIHRINCVNQFQAEIESDNKQDVIHIRTYQSIEAKFRQEEFFNFEQYLYIVSDEFHYFMGDSAFNKFSDISLEEILKQTTAIKIFMSATGETMTNYLQNLKKLKVISYNLPVTYDHIRNLYFFNKKQTFETLLDNFITENRKVIVFINSAEEAYQLYDKYRKHAMFNCSQSNKLYKFVDKEKIKSMLDNEKFNDLILITTTCMDAGVNLLDKDLRTVICEVKETDTMIQCIGRKRIQTDDDYVDVYIKAKSKGQTSAMLRDKREPYEKAKYFNDNGIEAYLKKYPRDVENSGILYDVIENGKLKKKINMLMYCKYLLDIKELEFIEKYGYRVSISDWLGRSFSESERKYDYLDFEDEENKDCLIKYLDSILEIQLFKKQQDELKAVFINHGFDSRTQGVKTLNRYLNDRKIDYEILSKIDKRRRLENGTENPNRDKTYWVVKRHNT